MRDQDESIGIVAEIFFEPVARFEVQMVGGFVEQQQVRLLEQQLGERDAHLPAAGEFFGAALQSSLRKPEPVEHGCRPALRWRSRRGVKFVLEALVALGDLRVLGATLVELRHAPGELFHLLFHGAQFGEHRHAFGEHGAAGERQPILRQVAGADAFGAADGAVIETFVPRDLQQRGFAGAVRAHETDAVARRDQPVSSFEQQLVAEALAGGGS